MIATRREFTAGIGAIVVAFSIDPQLALTQQAAPLPGSLAQNRMLDAWIRINTDGTATIFPGKVELGQGITTALTQIAAEELDLSLGRVRVLTTDTSYSPNEGVTSGSQSIEYGGTALRLASAEVRGILLDLAAKRFGVSADTLTVADGTIGSRDRRKVGYGELAADLDLHREATAKIAPKLPAAHKIVGKSIQRFDIPKKVTGGIAYVQDIRLPGMVHGRIVRPPRPGSKLDSVDVAAVQAMPGVVAVVRDGSFLGVVAEREEQAIKARQALIEGARWTLGPELPDPAKIYDVLLALPAEDTVISNKQAPVPEGATVIEATYRKPYIAHASIGPSCAVAEFKNSEMTVWTHSQGVFPLRNHLSLGLRLPIADIRCIHAEGSGCYGQNGADDVGLDAALLARAVAPRPVRLQWMRDDEFAWEPYGPAMIMRVKAALADGKIAEWNYDLWSNTHSTRPTEIGGNNLLASWYLANAQNQAPPRTIPQPAGGGDRNAIPLHDFPRQRVVHHFIKEMPLRVSALRTLGAYSNVFAIESFLDELARAAKADPIAFRLAHLKDSRARAVIESVARNANWKDGEAGDGRRGRGIGFAKYKNLSVFVAVIAEVEVDAASGVIKVPRAFAVVDAGQIVNPDGLTNQIQGGIIQSTSWTLHEQVRFNRDGITSLDWQGYPILTMQEVPHVAVELIDRPSEKSLGAGEGAQGPAVAAIVNAFANATGKRIRELPLTPNRVKAALG